MLELRGTWYPNAAMLMGHGEENDQSSLGGIKANGALYIGTIEM